MAEQIRCDDGVVGCQRRQDAVPGVVVAAQTVEEQQQKKKLENQQRSPEESLKAAAGQQAKRWVLYVKVRYVP